VHVGLFDPNNYEPDFFDYVTLDQVIEHVTDPLNTMLGIAKVLKPGGMAILSTPNANGWGAKLFGQRWINWHAPYHIQHFSRASMTIAAEQAGLAVERVRTITSSEWLYWQWLHLCSYPRMGEPSLFWSPSGVRSFRIKLIFGILALIHRTKVNHFISRFFDAAGAGDGLLIFLRKK
jgi:SAM-dependent methyltransferase